MPVSSLVGDFTEGGNIRQQNMANSPARMMPKAQPMKVKTPLEKNIPKANLSSEIVEGADTSFSKGAIVLNINHLGNHGPMQSILADINTADLEPKNSIQNPRSVNENEGKANKLIKLNQIEGQNQSDKMSPFPGMKQDSESNSIEQQIQQAQLSKTWNTQQDDEEPQFICCGLLGGDQTSSDENDSPEARKAKLRRKMNRIDRRPCLVYPEDTWKEQWDLFVSVVLIFTCAVTPFRLAFIKEDDLTWEVINGVVDIIFFIDMILIFNTAYYDEDFKMIQHRGVIACNYVRGWFFIDLLAIFPIGQIEKIMALSENDQAQQSDQSNAPVNGIVRIARIGRMYKLIKLTRLIRIFKIFKSKGSLFKKAKGTFNLGEGFERLVFFILMSGMICHIVACMWCFIATFFEDEEEEGYMNWLVAKEIKDSSSSEKYLFALYFTVTTITTVGYGDLSANNPAEQLFCIFIMLMGVVGFSLATSTLTQLLSEYNSSNKKLNEKMNVLKRVYDEYCLPLDLYDRVKKSLTYMFTVDMDELTQFMDVLPQGLKIEVSLFIHEKTYKKIWFLQDQAWSFIAFVCPMLKPICVQQDEYVYQEGDEVNCIYFLKEGVVGFVLPRHHNTKYCDYPEGSHFGVLDIISSCYSNNIDVDDWQNNLDKMKREFTVMSQKISEILSLSIKDLGLMKEDFEEQYTTLFSMARQRLLRLLQIKCQAIKHFQLHHERFINKFNKELAISQEKGINLQDQEIKLKLFVQSKIEPVDIREVDEESMLWTLNDSMQDYNSDGNYTDGSQVNAKNNKREKKIKKPIFIRTASEKLDHIYKNYSHKHGKQDHSQSKQAHKQCNQNEKNEIDAINLYQKRKEKQAEDNEMGEVQTHNLIKKIQKSMRQQSEEEDQTVSNSLVPEIKSSSSPQKNQSINKKNSQQIINNQQENSQALQQQKEMFEELMNKFQSVIDSNNASFTQLSDQINVLIKSNETEIQKQQLLQQQFDSLINEFNQNKQNN